MRAARKVRQEHEKRQKESTAEILKPVFGLSPDEQGLKSLVLIDKARKRCPVCGLDAAMRCSRCKLVFYCVASHQQQDWKKHKEVCHQLEHAGRLRAAYTPGAGRELLPVKPVSRHYAFRLRNWSDYFSGFRPQISEELAEKGYGDLKLSCGCYSDHVAFVSRYVSFSLTIISAITRLKLNAGKDKTVRIHVIGASDSMEGSDPLAFFLEAAGILRCKLEVKLIGPNLSKDPAAYSVTIGSLQLSSYQGLYHDFVEGGAAFQAPDLAVLFNAGLHVGESWVPTVYALRDLSVPVLVTEYEEREVRADLELLARIHPTPVVVLPPEANSFSSLHWYPAPETANATYSDNAWWFAFQGTDAALSVQSMMLQLLEGDEAVPPPAVARRGINGKNGAPPVGVAGVMGVGPGVGGVGSVGGDAINVDLRADATGIAGTANSLDPHASRVSQFPLLRGQQPSRESEQSQPSQVAYGSDSESEAEVIVPDVADVD